MRHIGAWVSLWTATPVTWRMLAYINPRCACRMAIKRRRVDLVTWMLEKENREMWT